MRITDNVFVVTGAGNGMGREVALGLNRRGAHVAAVDLDQVGLAATVARARGTGTPMSSHVLDITDRAAVAALPAQLLDRYGQIDGLVNIAGIAHRFALFADLGLDDLDRVLAVNVTGTVAMCQAFLPALRARPEANVTNMSSLSALIPFASQTLYGATKAAVKQFSEGLDGELADTNIHVMTVFPGNIATNLAGNSGVEMLDAGGRRVHSTTPEAAGAKIVTGIAKDRYRLIIGADAHLLGVLSRISYRRTTRLVANQIKSVL